MEQENDCPQCHLEWGSVGCYKVICEEHKADTHTFTEFQWLRCYKQEDNIRWSHRGWVLASLDLTGSSGYYRTRGKGTNLLTPFVEKFDWQGNNVDCANYNYMALNARERAIAIDTMPEHSEYVPFRR